MQAYHQPQRSNLRHPLVQQHRIKWRNLFKRLLISQFHQNQICNSREILSYLDNVDSTCIKTMQETFSYKIPDSFRSDIEFAVEPDIVGDMPKYNTTYAFN